MWQKDVRWMKSEQESECDRLYQVSQRTLNIICSFLSCFTCNMEKEEDDGYAGQVKVFSWKQAAKLVYHLLLTQTFLNYFNLAAPRAPWSPFFLAFNVFLSFHQRMRNFSSKRMDKYVSVPEKSNLGLWHDFPSSLGLCIIGILFLKIPKQLSFLTFSIYFRALCGQNYYREEILAVISNPSFKLLYHHIDRKSYFIHLLDLLIV